MTEICVETLIYNHYLKLKDNWSLFYNSLQTKNENFECLTKNLDECLNNLSIVKENKKLRTDLLIKFIIEMLNKRENNFELVVNKWNSKFAIHFKSQSQFFEDISDIIFQIDDQTKCSQNCRQS